MRALSALALLVAVAGCGGSAPPSCPAAPLPSGTPNPNADPGLADTFPESVAGQPLEVATFCVTELDELGGIETSDEMLDALGVSLDDLTIAAVPPAIGTAAHSRSAHTASPERARMRSVTPSFA